MQKLTELKETDKSKTVAGQDNTPLSIKIRK